MVRLLCLCLLAPIIAGVSQTQAEKTRNRPVTHRNGRFISAHMDMLSAASSLLPSLMAASKEQQPKSGRLVASKEDFATSDTIKDMETKMEGVHSFGAKLQIPTVESSEEAISDQIDAMDDPSAPPTKFVEIFDDPNDAGRHRGPPGYGAPHGYEAPPPGYSVEPLVFICEDPNYCPPPGYGAPYGAPHGPPPGPGSGLTICDDPNDCPGPYGGGYGGYRPPPYSYGNRQKAPVPTYRPGGDATSERPRKRYGYNPVKSKPTLWRQKYLEGKTPEDDAKKSEKLTLSEDLVVNPEKTVAAEDINQMSMEELREFIKMGIMGPPESSTRSEAENLDVIPAQAPVESLDAEQTTETGDDIVETNQFIEIFQDPQDMEDHMNMNDEEPVKFLEVFENPNDMNDNENADLKVMEVMGMEGIQEMSEGMEIIGLDDNEEHTERVKFVEIFGSAENMFTTPSSSEVEVVDESSPSIGKGSDFTEAGVPAEEEERHNFRIKSKKPKDSLMGSMLQRMKMKEEMKKRLKMKMRPMRVKLRKPANGGRLKPTVEDLMKKGRPQFDDSVDLVKFGLKEEADPSSQLILEPTPAVPGKPVTPITFRPKIIRTRTKFNEFLEPTTQPSISIENIKTDDKQSEDESSVATDYPIYETGEGGDDYEDYSQDGVSEEEKFHMPIFDNFPMLPPIIMPIKKAPKPTSSFTENRPFTMFDKKPTKPFIKNRPFNMFDDEEEQETYDEYEEYDSDYESDYEPEMPEFESKRPEPAVIVESPPTPSTLPEENIQFPTSEDSFDSLLELIEEEEEVQVEERPVRRPHQRRPLIRKRPSIHPNHRYPLVKPTHPPVRPTQPSYVAATPTPFTVRSKNTIVPHSYIRSNYQHPVSGNDYSGFYSDKSYEPAPAYRKPSFGHDDSFLDTADTPLFRDIPEASPASPKLKRFSHFGGNSGFKKRRPFVNFGNTSPVEQKQKEKHRNVKPFSHFGKPSPIEKTEKEQVKPFSHFGNQRPVEQIEDEKPIDIKPFSHFGNSETQSNPKQPFVSFAETQEPEDDPTILPEENDYGTTDYNDPSLVGIPETSNTDFFNQYNQHDDRPNIQLPTRPVPTTDSLQYATEEEVVYEEIEELPDIDRPRRRQPEIRFGGTSFVLPPPGKFPDRPVKDNTRTVSDVFPNHPISSVFPDRAVNEVFRDLPQEHESSHPDFPTAFPVGNQFSFDFGDSEEYLTNPFGDSFIKMEIDADRFDTNKTGPGIHHIPLDVYGYPNIPKYNTPEESKYGPPNPIYKEKPKPKNTKTSYKQNPLYKPTPKPSYKPKPAYKPKPSYRPSKVGKKPGYKPPPVITSYEPPKPSYVPKREIPAFESPKSPFDAQKPLFISETPKYPQQDPFLNKNDKEVNPFSAMREAMSNLPNALQSLPIFMEKLMSNHSGWIKRAWKGSERDESA